MAYFPPTGSVVAFQSDPTKLVGTVSVVGTIGVSGNPSVSGTVNVGNLPTNQNVSGSVVAFQGGAWTNSVVGNVGQTGTIITSLVSTIPSSVIVGASIFGALPAGNAVLGGVAASISGTVGVTQSTSPWVTNFQNSSIVAYQLAGSVLATSATVNPAANQSVSGTVHIDNFSSVVSYQLAGSILATSATVTPAANQSVSGTVGASVIGTVPVVQSGTVITSLVSTIPSSVIVGASIFGLPPVNVTNTNLNVGGSVVAFQGTDPWIITGSVQATVSTGNSSVQVLNFPANQSVSGAVSVSNLPTNQNVSGSVVAWLESTNASVITVGTAAANQSVSGTVNAAQISTWRVSVISSTPSSMLAGASIFGQLPAGTAMLGSVVAYQGVIPWTIGSVYGNISGSVAATITNTNVNVSGSVIAFQGGTVITSISGAVGGSSSIYGMRNDAVASFLGADLTIRPVTVDSAGRTVVKPFVSEDGTIISYQGSVVSGSVTLIQASAVGKRNYITDYWVANTGNAATLITFQGGDTSVVGYTIAPAGGGSNSPGIAIPLKSNTSQDLAFKMTTMTSVLYMTVKGYQAP